MSDVNLPVGLTTAWSAARTRARESVAWSRVRWYSLIYVILALLFVVGGEYAIAEKRVVATADAYVVFSNIPYYGIRGHGITMLLLGFAILGMLLRQQTLSDRWWSALRAILLLVFGYFLWTATLFGLAATEPGGAVSWIAVSMWTILAGLPLILTFGPPPQLVTADETKLVRMLRERGWSKEDSADFAEEFFRGGPDEPA